ncbi:nucleotidyltransferase domain-containing protein [Modestobacter roseus]|uniref:Nucleotidyltransferase-like protein n=1 Tax=Modestobacter roseus TaxID=1181884 RepID=A0A562IW02_9ACTN|nr:nucleotidyltransferase domain-containing protein [Modestobacter roseus]MQA35979.1 hypothetical protein [Modestobacter roseus]TWH75026.1 nucleotidyltransferase-like protein [Modestobacter roseus]
MDLSAPYRAVVPSLDGPVLRVLASTTRPLSGLEVHRLAGVGSDNGVRKVLARLAGHGLVSVSEAGPSLLYVANRHHLAWPAVQALVDMRQRLVDRMTMLITSWEVAPVLVGLYGSAARGDGNTESDIDLLVVRPEHVADEVGGAPNPVGNRWTAQVDDLREQIWSMTGNRAHVLEMSTRAFDEVVRSDEPIVHEWRDDLVVLAGPLTWQGSAHAAASTPDGGTGE